MAVYLLLAAIVVIASVVCNKLSNKLGVPVLLAFIVLGMLFGSDGIVKIPFADYVLAEKVCSVALIFIMFYGGFGTKWSTAKPIAAQALLLSSFGTLITAGVVGIFCYFILHVPLLESFLIGAVISSTDAASVFSILRSKRLNLRDNTAPLLEVESGSNDPFSYMLTVIVLSLMNGETSVSGFAGMLLAQIGFGIVFGFGIAWVTKLFLAKFKISSSGFSAIFLFAVAILAYALPALLGGNGYLSAYIAGIILGNCRLDSKQELVNFFDGLTGLMQVLLFFLLGLLSFPSQLPAVALTGLLVALFLTFVARPIAVFLILSPFKSGVRQQLLVSWAGMRGAASIVFAIMAVINPASTNYDIFHMVFFIVLFSILFQGTLIPYIAKVLGMTDPKADVMKTFNDYVDEHPIRFLQFTLPGEHPWVDKPVSKLVLPPESLFVLVTRGTEKIIPRGKTILHAGDSVVMGGLAIAQRKDQEMDEKHLIEIEVEAGNEWIGKPIADINLKQELIVMIRRQDKIIIPKGDVVLLQSDILVVADKKFLQ